MVDRLRGRVKDGFKLHLQTNGCHDMLALNQYKMIIHYFNDYAIKSLHILYYKVMLR